MPRPKRVYGKWTRNATQGSVSAWPSLWKGAWCMRVQKQLKATQSGETRLS
jgi:hypothetical protein